MLLNQPKKMWQVTDIFWSGPQEFKVKEGLKVSEEKRAQKGFEVRQEQNRGSKADKR